MKAFKYLLVYLLLIQLVLPYSLPFDVFFHHRMDYNLIKDDLEGIDVILDQISLQIKREQLQDYIVILGDSIAYSGPGKSTQSIGFYMQQLACEAYPDNPPRIYNLAMPAMQIGDVYTMLLKLDQHHISTDNIIVNISYSGFVKRQPGPPVVFWLQEDLKSLDKDSFEQVLDNLKANQYEDENDMQSVVHKAIWDSVEMYRYSPFLKKAVKRAYRNLRGKGPVDDAIGDARPWYKKEGLEEILRQDEYKDSFSSQVFDMSSNNPQIYFLQKIIFHQKNKHTLVFLAGANETLMDDEIQSPGYTKNLKEIDEFFAQQPVDYLNTQGQIPSGHFSDHVHLTAAGYQELAWVLWDNFMRGAKP
ncbi:MAG: hypothetical protein ABFD08_11705 [Syntrophomonas sp.]